MEAPVKGGILPTQNEKEPKFCGLDDKDESSEGERA